MSYYHIAYTSEYYQQLSDDKQQPLRYIDGHTLQDVETVKALAEEAQNHDRGVAYSPLDIDIQDYTTITDREAATEYIKANRANYQYIGYDTGRLDRILCVEISTINGRDKATAALYDHPEHGLDMY